MEPSWRPIPLENMDTLLQHNLQMGFNSSVVWKLGRGSSASLCLFSGSRKVSHAGSYRLTVTVSRGEIIGSSNLPICTLISCVIQGLLLHEAANLEDLVQIVAEYISDQSD